MRNELIRAALAERAEDVWDHGPDLSALHARVAATRRRRQAGKAIVASTVLVAAVAVAAVVARGDDPRPQPAPQPSPSASGTVLPFRAEAVEILPGPGARSGASRARVVTSLRNEPGVPTLQGVVQTDEERVADQKVCTGNKGTWLVVLGPRGARESMPCSGKDGQEAGTRTEPFHVVASNFDQGVQARVRMFVTTTDPRNASRAELEAGIPDATTATFGLDIWGQSSPAVATLLGHEVSALGEALGRDWWFSRGVEAPTGAETLTVELPEASVDRMVQTVTRYDHLAGHKVMPYVQLWVDGRKVDHRFDEPSIAFLDETTAYLPAGGPHIVELRVTRGLPTSIDFAAAVFEAGD